MLPTRGKAAILVEDGAVPVSSSEGYQENLVCVVHNGAFEAAAFVVDEAEFLHYVGGAADTRTKQWLIYEHAARLSGYLKE